MKFKKLKLKLTLAGLIISVFSLNSNAAIIISGDVTNGTGVFTITEDIVFNLVDGTAHNANADPYAILFHGWNTSFGAANNDKYQLVGENLDLRREPTPFNTDTDNIYVAGSGDNKVFSNELTSAPVFDSNFYGRGFALWFSDSSQRVRQLGFDDGANGANGGLFVIGAGTWDMPTISEWDLYGEFSGDATIYLALGYSETPPLTGSGKQIPVATTNLSSVPVPAAAWLFGSALVGLVGIGRKRSM